MTVTAAVLDTNSGLSEDISFPSRPSMRLLTQEEIDQVSGAWILNALGAAVGMAGGAVGAWSAGGDITDIIIAAGAGGVAGAIFPLRSLAQAGSTFLVSAVGAHVAIDLAQIADQWEWQLLYGSS